MLIALDLQPLHYGASGGIVQWLSGIFTAYAGLYPDDEVMIFAPDDLPPILPEAPSFRVISAPRAALHDREAAFLRKAGVEVLIRSYPHFDDLDFSIERQIVFIPDMQHDERPDFFAADALRFRRQSFGHVLARAGAVATMTDFSRQSILRNPWTLCDDVFLAPPSVLEPPENADESAPPWLPMLDRFDGFFFFPANPWPHKNHRSLFDAFARALPRLPDRFGIVLTGSTAAGLPGDFGDLPILHLGYVERAHLPLLYERATALSFFSLYEGFGMPLLEAFHYRTPVICSNIPALAEVGGDAVLACSPTDPDAIAALMVRIAADRELAAELVSKGEKRLARYNWHASAQAVRDATRRVAGRAADARSRALAPSRPRATVFVCAPLASQSLEKCLTALRGQTYRNFAVVVLAASPSQRESAAADDADVSILPFAGNDHAKLVEVIKSSTTEVNLLIRPDCRLVAEALARIVDGFAGDPGCDILACPTVAITPTGDRRLYDIASPMPQPGRRPAAAAVPFERQLLTQLSRDPRYPRPLVAWRGRMKTIAEPSPAAGAAIDIDYMLRLVEAGGTVSSLTEAAAVIEVSRARDEARQWADIMRDVEGALSKRGHKPREGFAATMRARSAGEEPLIGDGNSGSGGRRGVRRIVGWLKRIGLARRQGRAG
jgi:glycosyltransferase involved in cell wall biosynthesis